MLSALIAVLAVSAQDAPVIDTSYEPSPAHPFGRPNPDAPEQLSDFAFFIGAFSCRDERFTPDGSIEFPAIWNGKYFMNGHAIQDQYWSPGSYTSNLRMFDENEGVWKVTFFSEPAYSTGVWSGGKDGDDIVLTRDIVRLDGTEIVSRLTFYEITDASFRWKGESVAGGEARVNWTSDCARTR